MSKSKGKNNTNKSKKSFRTNVKLIFVFVIVLYLICLYKGIEVNSIFQRVALGMMAVVFLRIFWLLYKRKKLLRSGIKKVDKMSGIQFEEYLRLNLKKNCGFRKVMTTKASNDYGADLICYDRKGYMYVIQAKRYTGHKVGVSAVQEVYASKGYYDADYCMVITNSFYTNQAINLAEKNDVILMDRDDIINNFKLKIRDNTPDTFEE